MPTAENTHQVAERADGGARVVYVDRDPSALTHARALLGPQARAGYVHADIRDVPAVLEAHETRQLLDFRRPVAVLMVAVVHFLDDEDDPAGLVRRYVDELVPDSFLVVSSASRTGIDAQTARVAEEASRRFRFPVHLRSREEIAGMFGGLELERPGLVPVQDWPAPGAGRDLVVPMLGGVARVRGS
ncbi:SAM-dependent methyltransferase [Actinomadura madurae]|nr:SAM-dependent methyltransferase [Actinomadura madurae]MCP9964069.1 SAM-dependent methyltransferase [Actinomadura madurae]MCQ0012740.1 SAM-dependent methyltransferase [Actinomadura madurae]